MNMNTSNNICRAHILNFLHKTCNYYVSSYNSSNQQQRNVQKLCAARAKSFLLLINLACSAGVFIGRARPSLPSGLILLLSPIFLCHRIKDGGFIVAIRLTSFRPPKIRLHCRLLINPNDFFCRSRFGGRSALHDSIFCKLRS